MRLIADIPDDLERDIRRSTSRDKRLVDWLVTEIDEAFAARRPQEMDWRDELQAYEGVPKTPARTVPFENAPNIVITLGAIACNALYAQATDLIWSQPPVVTCRAVPSEDTDKVDERVKGAKALQKWVNWGVENEWGTREAWDDVSIDDIQLGTGVLYCPWVESTKKTDLYKVTDVGARHMPVPIENFLVPGGYIANLQTAPWVDMIEYLTPSVLSEYRKKKGWETDGLEPTATAGYMRSERERLGRTRSTNRVYTGLYAIHHVYAHFDYNDDGLDEDLYIRFAHRDQKIVKLSYNPYDRRPFEWARYQKRAHLAYGMGVMRMILPYQQEVTEQHNDRLANEKIVNMSVFRAKPGIIQGGKALIYHGKVFDCAKDDLERIELGRPNPMAAGSEALSVSLAERRVGSAEISSPRPSQLLGGRTPATTAISVLQQANRRFTPAFDALRFLLAGAVRQSCYRYREQLLAGNREAAQNIIRVLGREDGMRVIKLLVSDHFDESVSVEMTSSSVSINREADRQNMLALINVMGTYYDKSFALVAQARQMNDPLLVETAQKIATAVGELIDRTLRNFDPLRDPKTFVLDLDQIFDDMEGSAQGMNGLAQMMQGALTGESGGQSNTPLSLPGNSTVQ